MILESPCPAVCLVSVCLSVRILQICWTAEAFATRLGVMVYAHDLECNVDSFNYYLQGQGHSEGWLFADIFWSIEPFAAKLGMMVHHYEYDYEPECCAKWLECYHQGHSMVLNPQWVFVLESSLIIFSTAELKIGLLSSRSRSQGSNPQRWLCPIFSQLLNLFTPGRLGMLLWRV